MPRTSKLPKVTAEMPVAADRPYSIGLKVYPDVQAFVQAIESTRDTASRCFDVLHPANPNISVDGSHDFCSRSLEDMITSCRTLAGFDEAIARIESLAASLEATVPALPSVRRQRVKGASGYALNPHKVLRGDLAHAWTRMTRVTRPHGGRIARLMVCPMFSGSTSQNQIEWTTAATLALAAVLEASGRSCELWSVVPLNGCYKSAALHTTPAICLKPASVPWNTQDLALTADSAWLRRLHFRFAEMLPGLNGGYSKVNFDTWRERLAALAALQGWDEGSVLPGFTSQDDIYGQETAHAALTHKLAALAA